MKTTIKLNNGKSIPVLGLGTWQAEKNLVGKAVRFAILQADYKHIDCAAIYGNEKEIGEVFKEVIGTEVKREKIFITSKLWNSEHNPKDVEKACKKTLSDLNLKYLDLYLMHWGVSFDSFGRLSKFSISDTWQAMEKLVKKGLVKSIGVSNFTTMMIVDLLTTAKIKPVMNQIELHPYLTQQELVDFCKKQKIALTAYSPLGRPGVADKKQGNLLDEEVIKKLSKKYKKTPAQILLNWALCRGTIVIPKSTKLERIAENIDVFDFELTEKDQKEILSLNKNHRVVDPINFWGLPYFS